MNPRNEQFYDSPQFREFTYEFDFDQEVKKSNGCKRYNTNI